MDERLEKALDFSNYMTTLNNQRRLLHEKFIENCIHYINGGKFTVDKELINFCQMLVSNKQQNVILIDDNATPIEVTDLETFLEDVMDIYFTTTNEYFVKYNEIKKQRSVKGLIEL